MKLVKLHYITHRNERVAIWVNPLQVETIEANEKQLTSTEIVMASGTKFDVEESVNEIVAAFA